MVTHTRNVRSAFNPSKCTHTAVNTHTKREHTPGAVGSHLCCGAQGAVGGLVHCSRAPRRGIEGAQHTCTKTRYYCTSTHMHKDITHMHKYIHAQKHIAIAQVHTCKKTYLTCTSTFMHILHMHEHTRAHAHVHMHTQNTLL